MDGRESFGQRSQPTMKRHLTERLAPEVTVRPPGRDLGLPTFYDSRLTTDDPRPSGEIEKRMKPLSTTVCFTGLMAVLVTLCCFRARLGPATTSRYRRS